MSRPEPGGPRRLLWAGTLLGIGMGGLVDGIVFRQIPWVHGMVSARRPPATVAEVQVGMVWDGLLLTAVWLVALTGVIELFRAGRGVGPCWNGRVVAGAMLAGWGGFNLVEGIISHHVLRLHKAVESPGESWFEWAFLALGVLLLGGGGWLISGALPVRRHRTDDREVIAACALMAG